MARSNTGRGPGKYTTTHAPDPNRPSRAPWLAQPTACGMLRRDVRPTVERFIEYPDGLARTRKCPKCMAVVSGR